MTLLREFPVVYGSLKQAVNTLKSSEISKTTEVHQLLKVCSSTILDPNSFDPRPNPVSVLRPKMPLIVMEGLDGSGKTKVSTAISEELRLDRLSTPPPSVSFLKDFFDEQRESIRRAFYSIGNYVAAAEVTGSKRTNGVMMDRYLHSTIASAVATKTALPDGDEHGTLPDKWYKWPEDLLKPDLVLFLVVSEKVRQYRHKFRNTTNTKEEQALTTNIKFRESLLDSYRKLEGVPFLEIDADPEIEDITANVKQILLERFPVLRK